MAADAVGEERDTLLDALVAVNRLTNHRLAAVLDDAHQQ